MVIGFFEPNDWLSNMYPVTIKITAPSSLQIHPFTENLISKDTLLYGSVENAYQAAKFYDQHFNYASIVGTMEPHKTKAFVRQYSAFVRSDWESIKEKVMLHLLRLKFDKPLFQAKLKMTKGLILEANGWHDNFWGSCFCSRCRGQGKNILGQLIMQIRNEIVNERI